MNMLVVPKPLFNMFMEVEGYILDCQVGNILLENVKVNSKFDAPTQSPFFEFIESVGLEALTMDKMVFVPVTAMLLLTDISLNYKIDIDKIIFLMDKNFEPNPINLERVRHFREQGIKFAFQQVTDFAKMAPFLMEANYILYHQPPQRQVLLLNYLKNNFHHLQLVATDIDTPASFDEMRFTGIHLFDGHFYKLPVSKKPGPIAPLKANLLSLINIINQDDFEIKTFSQIVARDPALAIKFLRMAKSVVWEIKSINQAAAFLGQNEIKKWLTTAVATTLSEDRPGELTRIALVRALFAESLAQHFSMPEAGENLYLMGLFSILDVILDLPIEQALDLVILPEDVKKVLIERKGPLNDVYEFILQYEKGDWFEVSRCCIIRDLRISNIYDAYVNTLIKYSEMLTINVETLGE